MESLLQPKHSMEADFYFKGPIFALCFYKFDSNFRLLVGEGPFLKIFDLHTHSLLQQIQIFPSCFKILNIQIQGNGRAVFIQSEKSLKVLNPSDYSQVLYSFDGLTHDKIVHSQMISDGKEIILINAHNFLEVWNMMPELNLKERTFCEEECILYSADFNQDTQLIAGGTVFRTILIWKREIFEELPTQMESSGAEVIQPQGQRPPAQVLTKLEGHAGVILDVKFLKKDLVASCSDDRTLRLWKIDLQQPGTYQQLCQMYGHRSRIWKLRELGYQDLIVSAAEDATCKIWPMSVEQQEGKQDNELMVKAIETMKGHIGKNIRALSCLEGWIATGGEDGSIKVWNAVEVLNKKQQAASAQEQNKILKVSIPLPIQASTSSIAVQEDQLQQDQLQQDIQDTEIEGEVQEEEVKGQPLPKKKTKANRDKEVNQIRSVEIYAMNPILDQGLYALVATGKGTLLKVNLSQEQLVLEELYQDGQQEPIHDLAISKSPFQLDSFYQTFGVMAIGNGDLIVVRLQGSQVDSQESSSLLCQPDYEIVKRWTDSDIKLLNVFIVNEKQIGNTVMFDILTANGRGEIIKSRVIYESNQETKVLQQLVIFRGTVKSQFISALLIEDREILIAGDTKGHLFLFNYENEEKLVQALSPLIEQDSIVEDQAIQVDQVGKYRYQYQYLKAHKNERVISLYYCKQTNQLYSTSKDNYINIYLIVKERSIQKVQQIKEEDLNLIYQVFKHGQDKIVLLGYYGNNAFIWDKQENMQIFNIDTRGGNRPIRLRLYGQNSQQLVNEQSFGKNYILAFAQADTLTICKNWPDMQAQVADIGQLDSTQYTLQESLHGREILSACGFGILKGDKEVLIIITGSEDTFIRVSHFEDKQLQVKQTFSQHAGSVKSISKTRIRSAEILGSQCSEYIIVTAGSRMQANVFKMTIDRETAHSDMTHICTFSKGSEQDEEQDFRIMATSACSYHPPHSSDAMMVTAFGLSSGEVVIHLINFEKRRLEEITKIQLKSSILCLKKCKALGGQAMLFIAGLSNGDVVVLQITSTASQETGLAQIQLQVIAELKMIHEFGVNNMDALLIDNSSHLIIATGGDDQQIALREFHISTGFGSDLACLQQLGFIKKYAHSSSIKGLKMFKEYEESGAFKLKIVSSGYDQRFKTWLFNSGNLICQRISRHCLSDMNNMCKVKTKDKGSYYSVIVGQGLAIY